ncbi:MAG: type II 3-dehydroquinate dehydratase [Collinsella sp.]|nr:type II 3-dehydroquinate dehydratase [Collinsella sp.]
MKAIVINGPNINMLGVREPAIYGSETYEDLIFLCQDKGREMGFDGVACFQSNHEGEIVDAIQGALGEFDGIVINPAAYTHTSIAILDALKAVGLPAIEVHISDVDEREPFRHLSYVGMACTGRVVGEGIQGYAHALEILADQIRRA